MEKKSEAKTAIGNFETRGKSRAFESDASS